MKSGPVVVAGGLNTDILSRLPAPLRLGTSNPAHTTFSPGGVGRNLAQNLAQLGVPTRLLGVVGDDAFGESLLNLTAASGVDVSGVLRRAGPSGSYLAVLTEDGELHAGLSSMALTAALTDAEAQRWAGHLDTASALIVDANLPPEVVARLLDEAARRGVPSVLEPVSAPKAGRLRPLLSPARPVWLLSPDRAELAALTEQNLTAADDAALLDAAQQLRQRGADFVLITLGQRGSWLVGEGLPIHTPARQAQVLDVTGAGDALLAGLIAARWYGQGWPDALRQAHLCAALTIEALGAVRADLSSERLLAEWGRPVLLLSSAF
ncbi:PfkB family carbohydrate kinase [Deinococcus rubellus]|uniref:Carbohydrate kinase family protein n=1 Tax=Deinococcus rubellus TaxID=1889240 RepID=A0ABY5YK70_9DEIO|nr:carbohydrate kinase family protein [Deinococcus rubellus]UWX65101.1 carbohydrate kinase family protein [Deinococcus rubellus]